MKHSLGWWLLVLVFAANGAAADGLTVWVARDRGSTGVERVGQRFTLETKIAVKVEALGDIPAEFTKEARAGRGPDIIIWAHDRAAEWIREGLLQPVQLKEAFVADSPRLAINAFRSDGKNWGWPLGIEVASLIYNKALVPAPPKSFEEVAGIHEKLAAQKSGRSISITTGPTSVFQCWRRAAAIPFFPTPCKPAFTTRAMWGSLLEPRCRTRP
jgi:maltose-binding protein MalE